jgi:hypothetical protein
LLQKERAYTGKMSKASNPDEGKGKRKGKCKGQEKGNVQWETQERRK